MVMQLGVLYKLTFAYPNFWRQSKPDLKKLLDPSWCQQSLLLLNLNGRWSNAARDEAVDVNYDGDDTRLGISLLRQEFLQE